MPRVLSFLKPYRLPVVIALLLMLIELIVELWQPLLMAKIIDDGIQQQDMTVVLKWGGLMIGLSFIAFISGIINTFYAAHVGQSFGYDVRQELFKKVQSFSFANFNKFPTSSLVTRTTNDVTQVQNTVFMSLRIMLRAPLLIIGGTIMALVVNVKLALIFLASVPVLFIFLLWVMRRGWHLFQSVQKKLDTVNRVMRENLAGMRLIKAYVRKDYESNRFSTASAELRGQTTSVFRLLEITVPILLLVMNISVIAVLWYGNTGVIAGDVAVGEVVAIVNYATRITAALSVFSFIIMAFSRASASAERITEVLQTDIDVINSSDTNSSLQIREGKVAFRNVSFQYPEKQEPVIQNISFEVNPGETVAILGATGSGKTSIVQLIPRLYDVSKGSIFIDDHDIKTMRLEHLRRSIGFVPQEVLLFTGSIKENIRWGKEDASMEEIIEAAKHAQIHETIWELPNKYETELGQKGINLSGGQKQRISIARALVRKPKMLLLDDSTSALDVHTESKLLRALKTYACTTFVITQKISTAKQADKILLIDEQGNIQEGDHKYLLTYSDLYNRIVHSQLGKEALYDAQATN
ncbi:ABC transporter ATP-binding protein [Bacillus sp. SM2101]|uniref:ABC transporter ATP-binding protein n=1 Tax=Bacillus sp. SM2101 TaxID=2805366 RepID=UPI001BDE6A4B|nr:ABC transporter ATP-binding protein [Bacillus sp. SM2101]